MIGIDTNVLLRIFINDDDAQHRRCISLMEGTTPAEPASVNPIVLAEATWTLAKRFKRPRPEIAQFIGAVLDTSIFVVTFDAAARRALLSYEQGQADYADYLIAEINAEVGCARTYTFDEQAVDSPRYALVP